MSTCQPHSIERTTLSESTHQLTDSGATGAKEPNWVDLVGRVRAGNEAAMEELYRVFNRGVRYFLCRQLGPQDLEDKIHDTFLIVVRCIQRGEVREPERLMGFVRTIVRRQVAAYIDQAVQRRNEQDDVSVVQLFVADPRKNPEQIAIAQDRVKFVKSVLASLTPCEREILERFYVKEQTQEQIRAEMRLTATQFRLAKWRAKDRFAELGRRRLEGNLDQLTKKAVA